MFKLTFKEVEYDGDYNTALKVESFFSTFKDAKAERDADVVNMCNTLGRLVPDLQSHAVSVSFMEWQLEEVDLIDAIDCNILNFVDHGDGWKVFTVGGSVDKILQSFEEVDSIIIYNREDGREDPIDGSYKFGFVAGNCRGFVTLYDDEFESSIRVKTKVSN